MTKIAAKCYVGSIASSTAVVHGSTPVASARPVNADPMRGTPVVLKCPRCKRGKWLERPIEHGLQVIGIERVIRKSNHHGTGQGGHAFVGHRGIVRCLDCGYRWTSAHPQSGRAACWPIATRPCLHTAFVPVKEAAT